jgi:predicted DNA-binding ribbon-helix-helix protein
MKSHAAKRSIVVAGHKTGVSLEEAFWNGMKEICGLRNMTLSELVGEIDHNRRQGNLSSANRLFVLDYFKSSLRLAHWLQARKYARSMPNIGKFVQRALEAPCMRSIPQLLQRWVAAMDASNHPMVC